ncbi:MAG: decarboxylase [Deltaproteobacteria bacterium]|nr:decarboxylase [Deltaproteobacteria bacterium]
MTSSLARVLKGLPSRWRNRARPLPPEALQRYLQSHLKMRDILCESASRFGTPQYFLDETALSGRIHRFREAFSSRLPRSRAFYAVKSNSCPALVKCVVDSGIGLDVSGGPELAMALDLGCRTILFSGPGKTRGELLLALRNRERVTVLMDGFGEMDGISALLREVGGGLPPLRVGIRVRGRHHGIWNRFGIPLGDLGILWDRARAEPGLSLQGIQFHTSWNLDPGAQVRMIRQIGSHIRGAFPPARWKDLEFLDIGGGYWPEEGEWLNAGNTFPGRLMQLLDPDAAFGNRHYVRRARPLDSFARAISSALARQGPPLSELEIWMEPGRWLSHPAMQLLVRVLDRKEGGMFITDGGIHLLGWERPLSEYIPLINLTRPSVKERPLRLFGSLCTPLDVWGTSLFGQGVQTGDVILVPDQGAYTYSLRQSFIKPAAAVVRYNGRSLEQVEEGGG